MTKSTGVKTYTHKEAVETAQALLCKQMYENNKKKGNN